MPRVYTTLLKVTRIRLRISMTDCASLTSVCVAVADDAILTCSVAESGVAERAGCNQADDLIVVVWPSCLTRRRWDGRDTSFR